MALTYTVQSGDTLSKIAAQNGVSMKDITGYKSGDPNKIGVGEQLTINKPSDAVVPPPNSINVGQGATNLNQKQYTPPPATVPTAPTGLLGLAKATQDQITALQPTVDAAKKDITSTYEELSKQPTKQADLYASEGVNTKKAELDQINNEMAAQDKSYNDQVDRIRNENPTGQLSPGQQIQIDKLTKDHANIMANFALVANVKLGNYNTAKSIVDQRIAAETAGLQTKLDGLKFFYTENADKLSDYRKTLLTEQTKAVETELADKKDLLSKIGDVQLKAAQNGAPTAVINAIGAAGDVTKAISAAGSYLKSSTGAGTFTTGQINNGADAAGLPVAQFNALDPEVKNYFVNNSQSVTQYNKAVQDISKGDSTVDEVKTLINGSVLSDKVKTYLLADLDKRFPGSSSGGSGFWASIGNFFKGTWNAITQ